MAEVVELLDDPRSLAPLTGEGVAAHSEAQGWEAEGRPENGFEAPGRGNDVLGRFRKWAWAEKWAWGGRTLVAGVIQDDTDLPVRVVVLPVAAG